MQKIADILQQVKRELDQTGDNYTKHELFQKARGRLQANAPPVLIPSVHDRFREAECPTCRDIGRVVLDVDAEHPDFGKSFPCPDCHGATGGKDPVTYKLEKSEFGNVARGKEFSNFKLRNGTKEAYEAARQFGEGDCSSFYFLVLLGRNGTGKTHLAVAAGRQLIRQGANPRFIRSDDLLLTIKVAPKDQLEERIFTWKYCDALILDDWGQEDRNEWALPVIESILISRFEEYRPTLITSNLNTQAIADKETGFPRLYSRFCEAGRSRMIVVDAADYRQRGKPDDNKRGGRS